MQAQDIGQLTDFLGRSAAARDPDGVLPSRSMSSPLVAILSGAGISTDSGIPDYRGPAGLWRRDPEAQKLVTYDETIARHAEPNAAHRAITELDRTGVPVRVITQNVDGLHQLVPRHQLQRR